MNNVEFFVECYARNKKISEVFSSDFENAAFSARTTNDNSEISLTLFPKSAIRLGKVFCKVAFDFHYDDVVFCNGYQSWTACKERPLGKTDNSLKFFPRILTEKFGLDRYGDYRFYKRKRGIDHGYTYAYVRRNDKFFLFASLAEKSGYTIIEIDYKNSAVVFTKDCEGKVIDNEYIALHLANYIGSELQVFDDYFKALGINCDAVKRSGYTSWYNYYQDINESKLLTDLRGMNSCAENAVFQIDDGYESYVGDWLEIDKQKFPSGMAYMSDSIHEKNFLSGIWLAPFVCEKKSAIFRDHYDWILKDVSGKAAFCGCNWSGAFALDFYNGEVRSYIEKCLSSAIKWGFDVFKLDFLYAVAMFPYNNKTRGEIMTEAMDFLRSVLKGKLIIGCGVPLSAAFGKVDYCRIGADVTLDYDDVPYMRLAHAERPSTKQTMLNSVFRRELSGRAFLNDTDVYILRDNNTRLTEVQKRNLAIVNGLFGGLLFSSDNFMNYTEKQRKLYDYVMSLKDAKCVCVKRKADKICVSFVIYGKKEEIIIDD